MTRTVRAIGLLALLPLSAATLLAALPKEQGFVEPTSVVIGGNENFKLDGKFDYGEYSVSSNLLFCLTTSKRTSGDDARWAFSVCGDKFIAAVRTPVAGVLRADYGYHDGAIWEEDCHELFLVRPDRLDGYHFIVNYRNGLYDSRIVGSTEKPEWNCRDIRIHQSVEEGFWTSEFEMPLDEIADVVALPEFKAAFFRTDRTKDGYSTAQFRSGLYLDPEVFMRMHIDKGAPIASAVTDTTALCQGKLKVTMTGKGKGDLSWHVGVEPLDFGTNDAFNFAKEITVGEGRFGDGGGTAVATSDKLPTAGTLHYTIRQNGRTVFDRSVSYSLQDLQKFNIISINADAMRKNVCAMLALPSSLGKVRITSGLRDGNGKVLAQASSENYGTSEVSVSLKDIAPGKYVFFARTESGAEDTTDFAVLPEKPEWMGNTLGFTNGKAPAPWTDMVVNGGTARVWNREIMFDGIPVKMTSKQGCAADNIRFLAGDKRMTMEKFAWTEIKGDVSRFESVMAFEEGQMLVKGTLEFDGLVWLNCTFVPKKGKALPDISLKMDIPNGNGRFVYTAEHNNGNCHMLKKEQKWQKNLLTNKSTFWVGSPDVGISFVADDLRGWNLSDYAKSAQLTADDNGLRIATVPILEGSLNKADQSYQIEFALQATPTRPLPKGYSSIQINGGYPKSSVRCFEPDVTTLFNVPSKMRSDYKNRLKIWHEQYGVKHVLPYLSFTACSPFTDEYRFYSEQWRSCTDPRPLAKPATYMYLQQICPKGEGYSDWYMWELDKMNKEILQDGLYFDFGQPTVYPCKNKLHGCGWTDNLGNARPSMRMKAARELMKRIYVFMKKKNPDSMIALHNSGGIVPAYDCFSDFTWNGEQACLLMYQNNVSYRGMYDPGQLTLEQNGRIWGVPIFYIPQFIRVLQMWDPQRFGKSKNADAWSGDTFGVIRRGWEALPDTQESIMQFMGLLYAVGGDCSEDYGVFKHLDEMRQVELSIGWTDDTIFHGWYDERNPFKLMNPTTNQTIVSSYEAEKGWMVVALNDTKTDNVFRISVPENLRDKVFTEHITKQVIKLTNDGFIEIKMPAYCARFIIVKLD